MAAGRKKREEETQMGLKTVIPDMDQTFGTLYYAGPGEDISWSVEGIELTGRFHNFFADTLKGENVEVLVLSGKKEMPFEFGEPVTLVYPRVTAQNHKTESGGFSTLLILADDIREIGSWQDETEREALEQSESGRDFNVHKPIPWNGKEIYCSSGKDK